MKKTMLGLLCLIVAISCDIPQSVTVKGKPGLYLPMGSPFSTLEEGERLEDYLSANKIREKMRESDKKAKMYDYKVQEFLDNDIQAYIVHYPIVKMQHDLTDYVRGVLSDVKPVPLYNIPGDIGSLPPGEYYLTQGGVSDNEGAPMFTIPLDDMSRLVIEVTGNPSEGKPAAFGIDLVNYDESFVDNLLLKIPAFGITDYQKGTKEGAGTPEDPDRLRFVNPAKDTFEPVDDLTEDGELEIYVKILGSCSGTIEMRQVFEWTDALVNIADQNKALKGDYEIENFLVEFLGEEIAFKEVKGYIYVHGVEEATIELYTKKPDDSKDEDILPAGTDLVEPPMLPLFPDTENEPIEWPLPPHSIDDPAIPFIDLTDLLSMPKPPSLHYEINANTISIENKPDQIAGNVITADLLILLPLEFIVSTPSSDAGYVKLDLKGLPESKSDKDLFNRSDGDDDLFSNINSVTIFVRDFQNTVICNDISVLVASDKDPANPFQKTIDIKTESFASIDYADLPNPFIPRFEILLEKDDSEDFATLKVKRQDETPVFDFFLVVEATTDLNISL